MSRFFTEDWFYLAFNKPDCKIQYDDSGIDLEVSADTTQEQRRYLNKDLDMLTISMGIDATDFSPCVIIVNLDYSWRRQPGSTKRDNKRYYREKEHSPKKGSDKGPTMWYNWDEEIPK